MKLSELLLQGSFADRHIGPTEEEKKEMLQRLGYDSLGEFLQAVFPPSVPRLKGLDLPPGISEVETLAEIEDIIQHNKIFKNYIGLGYYPTVVPSVIIRNVLENPGWYTAYTPYQAEVSQGRLEALFIFQEVCAALTGMPLAGASLLDEATAAAEAMAMAHRISKNKKSAHFFVDERVLPQTLDVIKTRAHYFGFNLKVGPIKEAIPQADQYFGVLLAHSGKEGDIVDLREEIIVFHKAQAVVVMSADPMSLVLLKPPGSMGADIVIGSMQRFGTPMSFGGAHAAFLAFKEEHKRMAPGRLIGKSVDRTGKNAYRMALQTREQHIRREKATSNICTSQVLLAIMSGMYAVYHGYEGLKQIAQRIHRLAVLFARTVEKESNFKVMHSLFFDSVCIDCGDQKEEIIQKAEKMGFNLGILAGRRLLVAFNERSNIEELRALLQIFAPRSNIGPHSEVEENLPDSLQRRDQILQQAVFKDYQSEQKMVRYLKYLENKDISLTRSMIALGSCTMKLNSAVELLPLTSPYLSEIHPFAPPHQTLGYQLLIDKVITALKAISGFDGVSVQPNSGAQGEYTGLVMICRYLDAQGQGRRNICLIPSSAHGTNPASAQMAGLKVIEVANDEKGNVDVRDLREKAERYQEELAALMITYPSTHGVFEEDIMNICAIVHQYGGQVYMDGANMNAQVGFLQPAKLGVDVLHMNLHKTFAIPHGGGGPGVGPVSFKAHLIPYAPGHVFAPSGSGLAQEGAVAAAPYGSAGILVITWMYIRLMGSDGLVRATAQALLSANYIAHALKEAYSILFSGKNQRVAHECIIDLRLFKKEIGLTEVDFAKRLIDFGFHSPTMSFPVPGTLMIEPTESESKGELDRFIAALLKIRQEAEAVRKGEWTLDDNPLVNAPHTAASVVDDWTHAYSRSEAVYPLDYVKKDKYWPPISRVDEVYGDKYFQGRLSEKVQTVGDLEKP